MWLIPEEKKLFNEKQKLNVVVIVELVDERKRLSPKVSMFLRVGPFVTFEEFEKNEDLEELKQQKRRFHLDLSNSMWSL